MLSVKSGTQTWSKSEQVSSLKGDTSQHLSAQEREKVLGDQDLGTYLNKVADPNWVDPAKLRKVGNSELDKDAFLKLFLAQLKNQDPMNPLQNHELAAQLAQFSSLEKLNNIDTGIAELSKREDPRHSYEALNLIGRNVSGDSSKIIRTDEKDIHDVKFKLAADAEKITFSFRDANGQEVRKLEGHNLKKGENSFTWDGRLENGTMAQPGEYNVVIEARALGGSKVFAETAFSGKVTGVNYTAEGPVLMIGNQTVRMSEVKKILEAEPPSKMLPIAGKDDPRHLSPSELKDVKVADGGGEQAAGMGGNLESVGMSQGLVNKIGKEVEQKQHQQQAKGER